MSGLNSVSIIGNLGKDPETRYTQDGANVASFSVAVSEKWKDQEHVEWFSVVAFGKLAEICSKYLHKGAKVYICGKLRTREYEKNGEKRKTVEVVASEMLMLGGKEREEVPF